MHINKTNRGWEKMSYLCPHCRLNRINIEVIDYEEGNSWWCPACNCKFPKMSKPSEDADLRYIG